MSLRQFSLQLRLLLIVLSIRTGRAVRLETVRSRWGRGRSRTYQFDAIASSHASRAALSAARSIDRRTWDDLDLDEVFAALDHTTSTLGQHALYHRLRTIRDIDTDLAEFETLTTLAANDQSLREGAQLAIFHLQDAHGYDLWWLAQSDAVDSRRWYAAFPFLSAAALTAILVAPYWPWALCVLALNVMVRYFVDAQLFTVASGFRQFAPVIAAAESIADVVPPGSPALLRQLKEDVPALSTLKAISRWTSGNPLMLSIYANRWAVAISDFVTAFYEYLNLVLLLDATGIFVGVTQLRAQRHALVRIVATIGELDAAISVASYRASRTDWTRPVFLPPSSAATVDDLCHPLVGQPVGNSIVLHASRGVLVTGSNMAGKTTFLRTLGVNAVLAQTVNTCIGSRYEAPVFAVRSCIGRADDLLAGKSYYMVEVEALVDLLRASNSETSHLFLLDELFRGTNAVERVAAAHALLEELVGSDRVPKAHYVVAATHDVELSGMLREFESRHFSDSLGQAGLEFDYRLRPGPAHSRTAISLLKFHGAPAALIDKALNTARRLDKERRPGKLH